MFTMACLKQHYFVIFWYFYLFYFLVTKAIEDPMTNDMSLIYVEFLENNIDISTIFILSFFVLIVVKLTYKKEVKKRYINGFRVLEFPNNYSELL